MWIWGCVDEEDSSRCVFIVLASPEDAWDNEPRGAEELKRCLYQCGFQNRELLLTSDSWRATLKAVREYRIERGWPPGWERYVAGTRTCAPRFHSVVNHRLGPVNEDIAFLTCIPTRVAPQGAPAKHSNLTSDHCKLCLFHAIDGIWCLLLFI